jgi:hypothetical protein
MVYGIRVIRLHRSQLSLNTIKKITSLLRLSIRPAKVHGFETIGEPQLNLVLCYISLAVWNQSGQQNAFGPGVHYCLRGVDTRLRPSWSRVQKVGRVIRP